MWLPSSARAVLVWRQPRLFRGTFGIVVGLSAVALGIRLAFELNLPSSETAYSDAYVQAVSAAAMASAVWACILFSGGAWLIDGSLRAAFGLPTYKSNRAIRWARIGLGGFLLLWLMLLWAMGDAMRFTRPDETPTRALLLALGVWGAIAFDLKDMIARGLTLLSARLPALLARATTLSSLLESGPDGRAVRVAGTIVAGPETLPSLTGGAKDVVFRFDLDDPGSAPETVPFVLSADGHRARIELNPASDPVIAAPDRHGRIELPIGAAITVVGALGDGEAGPYRAGIPRMVATAAHPLRIQAGTTSWNRRLLIAAITELLAAAGMIAAAGLLIAFRLSLL